MIGDFYTKILKSFVIVIDRDTFIEYEELEALGRLQSFNHKISHHVVHDEVAPDEQIGYLFVGNKYF